MPSLELYGFPVSDFPISDITVIPPIPMGLAIVGMGQAGKTTARKIIADSWHSFDNKGSVMAYSASDGFRGLTAHVLDEAGISHTEPVDEQYYRIQLSDFMSRSEPVVLNSMLDAMYDEPREEKVLRSRAVNSSVAYTSEDRVIRPLVNAAAARRLHRVLNDPRPDSNPPNLVLLDARNAAECAVKFTDAGVYKLGTLVMTCPEEVVIARKHGDLGFQDSIFIEAVDELRKRNYTDMSREIGRMTLPVDLTEPVNLHTHSEDPEDLWRTGVMLAQTPESGAVLATDQLSIEQEHRLLDGLLAGMVHGAYLAYRNIS